MRELIRSVVAACALNLRSRNLRRSQAAFGLVWATEWAAMVAVGVIAFDHGGPAAVGLVGVIRMVPAALVAPVAATLADRARRERVLAGVGLVRALTLGAAGAVDAVGGPVVVVYVALVLATVAQTLFRPAHSALLPSLCNTPAELTSANVVRGLLDSSATLIGPLIAAVLIALSGPAAVLIAAAAASAWAAALAASLRYDVAPRVVVSVARNPVAEALGGIRAILADRALTLLTALATAQTITRGAVTVFVVVVSIKLLGDGGAGVGVLTAAIGVGAIAGSLGASLLVGRGGLARWFGVGVALWGAPLVLLDLVPHLAWALVLLAIVGVGNALVDVGVFTLIARLADDAILARVFAAFEGVITLGVAAGAILAPVLIDSLGVRPALVIIGLIAPLSVLVCFPALRRLDQRVKVRDIDVALLHRVPMLRPLPEATIEQLAARLTRMQVREGAAVFRQGDAGDNFFIIEQGEAEVLQDGRPVRTVGSGAAFGEIALIRDVPRTASVRALTALDLCTIDRDVFVAAVTRYPPSADVADRVISGHLGGGEGTEVRSSSGRDSVDRD